MSNSDAEQMWSPQQQQPPRKPQQKLSANERLQSIQSKLAWLQKLTMAEDDESSDNSASNDQHNPYQKYAIKEEVRKESPSEGLKMKLELVSQLVILQEHVIAHIERLQQCSVQLERLSSLKRTIEKGNQRLHFNAILLDGLQKDASLQERLHRQMEDFRLQNINLEKSI